MGSPEKSGSEKGPRSIIVKARAKWKECNRNDLPYPQKKRKKAIQFSILKPNEVSGQLEGSNSGWETDKILCKSGWSIMGGAQESG